jgi:plastocyanin
VVILTGNFNESFTSGTVVNGNVQVKAGTRVVWDWNDPVVHSTTSDTGLWDSNLQQGPDQDFDRTFNTTGTFPYHCQVHGAAGGIGMSGTITVVP